KRDEEGAAVPVTRFHTRVTTLELAPAALLALAGLVLAFLPGPVEGIITAHTGSLPPLDPEEAPAYLALWHGWTPILALSAGVWVLGALLALGRPGVEAFQRRVEFPVDALRTYRKITGALDEVAIWVTGRTQTGSLRRYLGIILATAFLLPAAFLLFPVGRSERTLATSFLSADVAWFQTPAQLVVVLMIAVATVFAVRARRRFKAIMLVSVTGYGAAALFAMRGAPDLAITQVLVETIILVTLILGLRVLPPDWYDRRTGSRRLGRLAVAVGFALTMMWIAATALAARTAERISLPMPELAYTDGYGTNAVNVTLVDIRAWDTWGEITVLAAAATGV
ncbi:Na+/H+ antiporter subunit A, partial [Streptococcus agalactiae]